MKLSEQSTNSLREALGQVIANERREWRRERELIEAQSRETIAELRAKIIELEQECRHAIADRLSSLKDGEPGRDGTNGIDGKDGRDGTNGKDGADGRDGKDGEPGAQGERGERGLPGEKGDTGERGEPGIQGERGEPGLQGERGLEGAPGKLPIIRAWEDRVYYEGEAATKDGATYQALRDTGRTPPHEDWICIAAAGRDGTDGRSFEVRGTYKPEDEYLALNVVALNGASFVAKRDEPGPCPGEGWQLIASQGKQGKPGERGAPGQKGDRGSSFVSGAIDKDGVMTLRNGDGTSIDVDLYPALSRIV